MCRYSVNKWKEYSLTTAIMRAALDVGVIMKENFNIKTNNIKHKKVIYLLFKGYKTVIIKI